MLLRSRPDTVHRDLLRRTQTSSPLMKRCSTDKEPRFGITPAVADCRYRAPLSPRLRGLYTIPEIIPFVKRKPGKTKTAAKAKSAGGLPSPSYKKSHGSKSVTFKAPTRIELVIRVLQTLALPLGYGAVFTFQ